MNKTVYELKQLCIQHNIKGCSKLHKQGLIEKLQNVGVFEQNLNIDVQTEIALNTKNPIDVMNQCSVDKSMQRRCNEAFWQEWYKRNIKQNEKLISFLSWKENVIVSSRLDSSKIITLFFYVDIDNEYPEYVYIYDTIFVSEDSLGKYYVNMYMDEIQKLSKTNVYTLKDAEDDIDMEQVKIIPIEFKFPYYNKRFKHYFCLFIYYNTGNRVSIELLKVYNILDEEKIYTKVRETKEEYNEDLNFFVVEINNDFHFDVIEPKRKPKKIDLTTALFD